MFRSFTQFVKRMDRGGYRRRPESRRIDCPHPDYRDVYVVLPAEWLGVHAVRRDQAVRAAARHKSDDLTALAIALAIVDDWGGIAGLDGDEPEKWQLDRVPIPVIAWLTDSVMTDFASAYVVPKEQSPPYGSNGTTTAAARLSDSVETD